MARGKQPTPRHHALVAELRDEWRQVALGTAPADRAAAERAVTALYRRARVRRPPVLWFDSPLQAAVALAFLTTAEAGRWERAREHLGGETVDQLSALHGLTGTSAGGLLVVRDLRPRPGGATATRRTRRMRQWLADALAGWSGELRRTGGGVTWVLQGLARQHLPEDVAARARYWLFRGVDSVGAALTAVELDFDTRARPAPDQRAHPRAELARNVGWSWLFEDLVVLSDRPEVLALDERGVPHATAGPALAWRDGWRAWVLQGVLVPRRLIEAPAAITVQDVHHEPNQEVRRLMLERFGIERYLYEADVTVEHRDGYGVLYSAPVPGDEPITMVEVLNTTAEPDGTFKRYLLRVPPWVRTAHEAVAWTFGQAPDAYWPNTET